MQDFFSALFGSMRKHGGIAFLILVYVSGTIGMRTAFREWFVSLTAANLLLSAGLLLWYVPQWTLMRAVWCVWAAVIGFVAEWVGVNTGLLFGEYQYGTVLGWQWQHTPLLIAVNWMMVTYIANEVTGRWIPHGSAAGKAAVAASVCTGLDILIEPTAIRLGYWTWAEGVPPLQNYVAWWALSFLIALPWPAWMGKDHRNKVAPVLLCLQLLFFAAGLFL